MGRRENISVFSEDTEYRRNLGLVESISIVVGRIIGSGIFRTPGPIMALAGSVSLFGLVWMIGGIVTIFHAVCYAELASMMPRSGGPYAYIKTAYGPVWAFLRGWAMFFVSETGAIAAVALVCAEYGNQLWAATGNVPFSHGAEILAAILVVWVLTGLNCFGIAVSGIFQIIFSALKVAAIGGIIGICFSFGGNAVHLYTDLVPGRFTWKEFIGIGAALRLAFFAFSGWEGATYIAEEVRNPRKILPLSIFLGICTVLILYAGTNAAYLYQLGVPGMAASRGIAADAVRSAIGAGGGALIAAAVVVSTFGNVGTQVLCKARTWQAMAADGIFFDILKPLHPFFKTPNRSMIAQGAWATVILFALFIRYRATGIAAGASYETVIAFFSATGAFFNIMTIAAIFYFRKHYPNMPRPYRAWLYPWSVWSVVVLLGIYLIVTVVTAPVESAVGAALTLTGLVYYYRKVAHDENEGMRKAGSYQ